MPTTTRGEFPYPAGGDNWKQLRLQIQALAQQVASVAALYSHADPRPAAGTPGRLHRNPTTGVVSYDSGTAWVGLTVAPLELVAATSTVKPFAIRGAAAQTANLAEFQNSAGTVLAQVTKDGTVAAVAGNVTVGPIAGPYAGFYATATDLTNAGSIGVLTADTATRRGLVVRGAVSQTANLAEFQSSAGTVVAAVAADGRLFFTLAGLTGTREIFYGGPNSGGAGLRALTVIN